MANRFVSRRMLVLRKTVTSHATRDRPAANKQEANSGLLGNLRNALALVAIYVYFTGWTYVYYYYDHFGVSLYVLDIPVYYFFAFSSSVLGNISIVATAIIFAAVGARLASRVSRQLTIPLLILSFPIIFSIARVAGEYSAQQLREASAKPIVFTFKDAGDAAFSEDFKQANEQGNLRLLQQTKDVYFVFVQPPSEEAELARATTFAVSRDDVLVAATKLENVKRTYTRWLKIFDY